MKKKNLSSISLIALFLVVCAHLPLTFAETARQTKNGTLYVNEDFGFSFACPKDWFMHIEPPIHGTAVLFNKSRSIEDALPSIALVLNEVEEGLQSSVDLAHLVVSDYQQRGNVVIEPISKITIGRTEGVRFSTEYKIEEADVAFRLVQYVFEKEGFAISVMYGTRTEDYKKYRQDFKKALLSFAFLESEDDFMALTKLDESALKFKTTNILAYEPLKKKILQVMRERGSFKSMFLYKNKKNRELADYGYVRWRWLMNFNAPKDFEIHQRDYAYNVGDIWRIVGDAIYSKIGTWMPMPMQGDPEKLKQYVTARKEIYMMLGFRKYFRILQDDEPVGIARDAKRGYMVIKFRPLRVDDLFTGRDRPGAFQSEVLFWIADRDTTIRFVRSKIWGKDTAGRVIREEYDHFFGNYDAHFLLGKPEIPLGT